MKVEFRWLVGDDHDHADFDDDQAERNDDQHRKGQNGADMPKQKPPAVRLASCSLLKEMAMIGTMVASIHSIPDTVPAAGIRNISTLTGMKNSMASQNSRLLERPRNSMYR